MFPLIGTYAPIFARMIIWILGPLLIAGCPKHKFGSLHPAAEFLPLQHRELFGPAQLQPVTITGNGIQPFHLPVPEPSLLLNVILHPAATRICHLLSGATVPTAVIFTDMITATMPQIPAMSCTTGE